MMKSAEWGTCSHDWALLRNKFFTTFSFLGKTFEEIKNTQWHGGLCRNYDSVCLIKAS